MLKKSTESQLANPDPIPSGAPRCAARCHRIAWLAKDLWLAEGTSRREGFQMCKTVSCAVALGLCLILAFAGSSFAGREGVKGPTNWSPGGSSGETKIKVTGTLNDRPDDVLRSDGNSYDGSVHTDGSLELAVGFGNQRLLRPVVVEMQCTDLDWTGTALEGIQCIPSTDLPVLPLGGLVRGIISTFPTEDLGLLKLEPEDSGEQAAVFHLGRVPKCTGRI